MSGANPPGPATAREDSEAWLILLAAASGSARLRRLIETAGSAAAVLAAGPAHWRQWAVPEATSAVWTQPDRSVLSHARGWLEAPDHHLLTWSDPDYPALLRDTPNAPAALFVAGDPAVLWHPQIAIVGARSASAAGLRTATDFAATLARAGLVVTSGLASGVDGAAHKACLAAGQATIAVAGTGPDRVYPARHRELAREIVARGAVVSEFLPGTGAQAHHFPRRNRIIAGLALGTLVIEAGVHSGSLITARLASEQGREVFAIPGSIHNPLARGCHRLIRDGAKLVETAEEVLNELAPLAARLGAHLRARLALPESTAAAGPTWLADPEYQKLLAVLTLEPQPFDSLVELSGLQVSSVSSMLLMLELEGLVATDRGGCYSRSGALPGVD